MYVINFHIKFSSAWFAGLSIVSSGFTFFGQFESTKLNSIQKVLDGKARNFLPTKISSFTVVAQIEAEKNGEESAHASMPLSMALKPRNLVIPSMTSRLISAPRALSQQTQDKKCHGQRMFSKADLVYLSLFLYFIYFYFTFCLFTCCMCGNECLIMCP